MTLTEKWKNGELPSRDDEHEWLSYYIKHNDGYIHADSYWRGKWGIADRNSIAEILAPVPSYQEYLESEAHCAVYSKVNKQLRQLLKDCKEFFEEENPKDFTVISERMDDILTRINAVIGESEEQ